MAQMTVKELVKVLQGLDQDRPVYIRGYEGGVDDVSGIESVRVQRDVNEAWYYGDHEPVDEYDDGYEYAKEGFLIK